MDAFKLGNEQHIPKRSLKYKEKLGYAADDPTVGSHDDEKVYFVFDYDNKLMYDEEMEDLCELFYHLDNNKIENDDEKIHFLMGQEYNRYDVRNIICNNRKPDQIKPNTFFDFEEELLFNTQRMERIYDITCPAIVEAPDFGGSLNLGNHVQWIDIETVKTCHLQYYNFNGDKTKQDQLDMTSSYIEVKDYLNDDNTFKKNDYLLTAEKIFEPMKKLGCTAPVVKIVRIREGKKIYNEGTEKEYVILKLFLTLPDSPMEYILDAKVDGDVEVDVDDQNTDKYNNPYNSAYNDEFYGISIEEAGMEYADMLSEDELYDYVMNGMKNAITYHDHEEDGLFSANYFDDDMLDDFDYYDDGDETINLYYDENELYYDDNEEDYYKFMDEYDDEGYYSEYDGDYGYYDEFDDDYYYDEEEEEFDEILDEFYAQGFETIYDVFEIEDGDLQYLDSADLEELYEVYNQYMVLKYGEEWPKWVKKV